MGLKAAPPPEPLITAKQIEKDLVPVVESVNSILIATGNDTATPEEGSSWRQATARVMERYAQWWILPEIIWLLATLGPALRIVKDKGIKVKLAVVISCLVPFGAMLVARRKMMEIDNGTFQRPQAAAAPVNRA